MWASYPQSMLSLCGSTQCNATSKHTKEYPNDGPRGGVEDPSLGRLLDDDIRYEQESVCERCKRTFKGAWGVKIHQAKKKRCGSTSEACSKAADLRETEDDRGQELHHSAHDTQSEEVETTEKFSCYHQRERLPRLK